MSGTMQQAFETAKKNPTKGQQVPTTSTATAKPRVAISATAVVARAFEALKASRKEKALQQTAEADSTKQEEVTEQVAELRFADADLMVGITSLNKERGRHPRGSVRAEEVRNDLDEKTAVQSVVKEALKAIETSNHSAYTEGTRRYNTRQEALEMADANRLLIGSTTVADIRSRISGAVEAGFVVVASDKDEATVSFDKQSYGSAWPHDPSISDVAASLKELVDDLGNRNEISDNKIVAELVRGGFYISARRDPDTTRKGEYLDSELDLLRKEPGLVRKASEFLDAGNAGNGQRFVVRLKGGFVVLENRNGEFYGLKASSARAGRVLFTRPDRNSPVAGTRVAANSAPKINKNTPVTSTDVTDVWDNNLRMALEENLRRETKSTERRETADELRDISKMENPLTLTGVAEGGVGTAPVSINYQDPETNRRHTVTFQVTGNGTHFSVTGTVPGTEDVIKRIKRDRTTRKVVSSKPFLTDFVGKEMPLGVLEQDPLWRLVHELNREFERDWQLAREVAQRNAVPVTAENLDGLTAIEGTDGLYSVRATIRKNIADRGQKPEYRYNSVGYIMERKGSKVQIVWAVPGTSVAFANDLRGELEISDLPWRARLILGNVFWWVIRKTNAPEHLRLTKRQSEDETEAKE